MFTHGQVRLPPSLKLWRTAEAFGEGGRADLSFRAAQPVDLGFGLGSNLGVWWRGTESNCRHYDYQSCR